MIILSLNRCPESKESHLFMGKIIYQTVFDFYCLLKCSFPFGLKLSIAASYLKITFNRYILSIFCTLRKENILGMKVFLRSYREFHYVFREIFLRGEYLVPIETRNPVIIDCGANIGMATMMFAMVFDHSRITAFEPLDECFRLLSKNVKHNFPDRDIRLINAALAGTSGTVSFYVDQADTASLTGSFHPDRGGSTSIQVNTVELSRYCQHPVDLLKMDIEGAEVPVLEELEKSGCIRNVRSLVMEYHHNLGNDRRSTMSNVLNILERNGFRYQISGNIFPLTSCDSFQDIMVFACQNSSGGNSSSDE